MKNRIKSFLLGILCISLAFCLTGCFFIRPDRRPDNEPSDDEPVPVTPLMWKVTGDTGEGTVYLFGSIHIADDSYWDELPEVITDAYSSSDALAVELDMDRISNDPDFMDEMNAMMMYPNYPLDSLSKHVGTMLARETIAYLSLHSSQVAQLLGVPENQINFEMFNAFTPAAISSLISDMAVEHSGLSGDWGVDSKFLERAKADGKQIIELEEVEMQMDLLYNMSDPLSRIMLISDISVPVSYHASSLMSTYNVWKTGDLAAFTAQVDAEIDFTGSGFTQEEINAYLDFNDRMGVDRNIPMAEKASEMIDEGRNVFYIVGEAHMVGRNGLASLLEDDGYTVELLSGKGVNYSKPEVQAA